MIDEYIDIVSKDGVLTGKKALKSDAHKNGWYHNTIHLWLYTEDGKILLQQRSYKKKIHPLLWDVSVAGHIDAGESFTNALLRETQEEIGLELKENALQKIDVRLHESEYNNGAIKDYEFHHIYISLLPVPLESLVPEANEVEALKLVSFKEYLSLLNTEGNRHFITSNAAYYKFVLETIKTHLEE